jgi:hypothetical protein
MQGRWSRQRQWVQNEWEGQEVLGPVEGHQMHQLRNLPEIQN